MTDCHFALLFAGTAEVSRCTSVVPSKVGPKGDVFGIFVQTWVQVSVEGGILTGRDL